MLQPRLDEGDTLPSFQLFLLAASYIGIRNYSKALAITDLLQKQIDKGDRTYVGSDLTVLVQLDKVEDKLAIVTQVEDKENQNRSRAVVLALKKDLQEKAPAQAALVSVTTPATAEIQSKIKDDETLLEYYCAGKEWHVFILTGNTGY